MPKLTYQGRLHEVAPGQTVLEALLAAGEEIPHSCRAGACGACIVRATAGEVPASAQIGLRDAWRQQGYFHTCRADVGADLVLEPIGEGARVPARIEARHELSPTVTRLRVRALSALPAIAGQYLTLHREGVSRSYSIAAIPEPGLFELHVRLVPGGALSPYLCRLAAPGDELTLLGPLGHCTYAADQPDTPLLLACTGTGLAPLWGVLHDALAAGHRGALHLFHGALTSSDLYFVDELRALAAAHTQLRYRPSALRPGPGDGAIPELELGPLDELIGRHLPSIVGMRAFVCGAPDVVATLKRKWFLAGMPLRDISADAFLPSTS